MTSWGKNPVVLVIDGLIGSGKTTLIDVLNTGLSKKGWKITVVKEPVDKWLNSGILQRFYADQHRWGYHFQTKAFHDRVVENIKAFEDHGHDTDVFILERSPFTDTLFMEVLHDDQVVDDLEMKHYREWWALWYRVMPYNPDLFLYLNPSIDACMSRLESRNRDGEGGVSIDYQKKLEAKHDQFFLPDKISVGDGLTADRVRLQTDENFKDDEHVKNRIVNHVESLIENIRNPKM